MSSVKNIFFLVVCLLVGLGIGKGFVMWKQRGVGKGFEKHEDPILVTGVGDAPGQRGFAIMPSDLPGLPALLKRQQTVFATSIGVECTDALSKAALSDAVKTAHRNHMSVILLPPPAFNPRNPYPRPLKEIATEAQQAEVDTLCISWLNTEPDDEYWKKAAAEVRSVFQGRLILAATPEVLPWVTCWEVVDVVGAIGPVSISHRTGSTKAALEMKDLRVSWDSALTSLESLARINTKPLALLHMDIPPDAADPQVQKLAYEALLLETKGRAQVTDVLLFDWNSPDAPQHIAEVQAKMTDAWDPKKPRLPDPPATEAADEADDATTGDAATGN